MVGFFSSFSGIYQTIYDTIVGNVLNLLPRFPKGQVPLKSVFSELCKIWGVGTATAFCRNTKEPLLEICCWQGEGDELI